MAHTQYVDKDDVKTWLGITGTGQDANLILLLMLLVEPLMTL
jgi:hypothetical protein